MNLLLASPIIIPLLGGAASLLMWRSRSAQRAVALVASVALVVAAVALLVTVRRDGIAVTQIGGWPSSFGIVLVADLFSVLMLIVSAVIWLAVVVYSFSSIDTRRESFGYYPLLSFLMMGVCGAFLTGDLFNLYVWFEVMLIASFVLMALGGERAQMESALKYVTLNLMSSALFLAGIALLYGVTGVLNMAELATRIGEVRQPGVVLGISMLFLVAFGIKAAVFPLFFWLPESYHTPPAAASAIFAGLLTKVGVYALIRVFTLVFAAVEVTHALILLIAGLTMLTGVFGAVAQNEMRRILSFHIVSQIGYMIMGLGIFTRFALAASIFYMAHHMIVKTNLFLVSGAVRRLQGTYELRQLGGLYRARPLLAALFLIPAMSLAGIPPLSGFFAKLGLVRAGIDAGTFGIVAVAIVTGFFTLYSMTKIWNEAFWKEGAVPADAAASTDAARMQWPIGALAAVTIAVGLGAGWLFDVSVEASAQMLDRRMYIEAVLR